MAIRRAGPAFWDRLAHEIEGDAASGFTRGRYATDASMYQCFPAGVACPKSANDVAIIVEMAREGGLPIIARGGGTSTAGQALGEGYASTRSRRFSMRSRRRSSRTIASPCEAGIFSNPA
jgi:hypothetical protein